MAEKEERIRVLIAKNPCNECSVKKCTRKCTFGLLFEKAPGITRTEAIEKMAKAICNMGDEETWVRVDDNYKHYCTAQAEWALNALLKGE